MDSTLYISFLVVSIALIAMPGPNIVLIVSTALSRGRIRGLQTVVGTTVAMAIQLAVAAVGTAWIATMLSETFTFFRWLGAIYLIYLGWQHLRAAARVERPADAGAGDSKGSFWRGFLVSMTNPKTILFFGAFLPQFTTQEYAIGSQIAVLSVSFLLMATVIDVIYATLAGALHAIASRPGFRRWCDGCAGALFVGSGAALALARR